MSSGAHVFLRFATMIRLSIALLLSISLAPAPLLSQRVRVVVGANVSISAPVDAHHRELMMAAAPWNADVLIAGGVESSGADQFSKDSYIMGRLNVAYTSTDGGATWRRSPMMWGSDPQVAA